MVYLVVKDAEDRGVYAFEFKSVAEDIASHLNNYVFMHEGEEDKAKALIGASEISDALFLIRKYRSKNRKRSKKNANEEKKAEALVETKKAKDSKTVVRMDTQGERFSMIVHRMRELDVTCVKITMYSGLEYVVFLKSVFFATDGSIKGNLLASIDGEIVANSLYIDNYIKNGKIGVVKRSRIEYVDDFAIISGADDEYSPDVDNVNGKTSYKHRFEKIVIDTNRIESIIPFRPADFGDFTIDNDVVVSYLVKKML